MMGQSMSCEIQFACWCTAHAIALLEPCAVAIVLNVEPAASLDIAHLQLEEFCLVADVLDVGPPLLICLQQRMRHAEV